MSAPQQPSSSDASAPEWSHPEAPGFDGTVHGTCVAIDGAAVLITGPSGSGKSDLALRLIDRGATLVSDDYTRLFRQGGAVLASAPANIAGQMEVRALGIVTMAVEDCAPLALVLDLALDSAPAPARYPLDRPHRRLCGRTFPLVRLRPFEASAPIKAEMALRLHRDAPEGEESAE